MELLITQQAAQAIHDYLIDRPMREVEVFVKVLRALPPAPVPEEPQEPPVEKPARKTRARTT